MMLRDCTRGDLVVVVWPEHDYEHQHWLSGLHVMVKVSGMPGRDAVLVQRHDMDTLFPVPRSARTLPGDVEVVSVVEPSPWRTLSRDQERALKHERDLDPFAGRQP